jgi:hypothetical protein
MTPAKGHCDSTTIHDIRVFLSKADSTYPSNVHFKNIKERRAASRARLGSLTETDFLL